MAVGLAFAPSGVTVGEAPPVFSPTDITGLLVWYRADALSLGDNDPVSSWTDSSGNASHATQGTGGLQPTYKTGIINGKPVVRFDGSPAGGEHLDIPNVLAGAGGTVFVVGTVNTDPPADIDSRQRAGPFLGKVGSDAQDDHWPYVDGNIYIGPASTVRKTVGNPTPSLTAPRIYSIRSAPSSYEVWLDGTSIFSTGTNTVGWGTAAQIGKSTGSFWLDGDVADILIYNSALTTDDRESVEDYLGTKYGITVP